ncbi:hypothetical protein D9623_02535 [Azospirillum brasilense]|uniref:Uncharacterized protein n=1 Tax=Azospirillum brasilense TaxID=192 RepID=A0A4D8QUG0_AZOBR|nr:hypothetical protein D3868_07595 [Azospirillum brasilense]QEL89106.1 hypothetical protein D9621_02530 [Azospirillum brasilense]QEL95355.1 hypothetical protein D9623_02535 [Azospirillum brasilense]
MSSCSGAAERTERYSAYSFESARVEYPWHPLYGKTLRVVNRTVRGGHPVLWLEERPGTARELPAWMCDAAYCLDMAALGPPQATIIAFGALAAVLSDLRRSASDRAASDNSPTEEVADDQTTAADIPALACPYGSAPGSRGSGRGRAGPGGPPPGSRRSPAGHGEKGGRP